MPHTKRILCADDNQEIREMLTAPFGAEGYEVRTATPPVGLLNLAYGGGFSLYLIETVRRLLGE